MKRVCITADDFGLRPENDRVVLELADAGRLDAVALMLHEGSSASALPSSDVALGLHVVLVGERPLRAAPLARWLDRDGRLPGDWAALAWALTRGGSPFCEAIETEISAQLDRYGDFGRPLDLLNAHQHVHLLPPVWRALSRQLEQRRWRPVVRVVDGTSTKEALIRASGALAFATTGPPDLTSRARGLSWSGRADQARVASTVRRMLARPDPSLHELVFHPGRRDGVVATRHARWGYAWDAERELLSSGRVDLILAAHGAVRDRPRAR